MTGGMSRARYVAASGVVAAIVAAAAVSWACLPQAALTVQPRSSGPPGTELTVEGTSFESSPVEIRWNAIDGPLLGSTSGPGFSVPVTIPQSPDGLYVVFAFERGSDGGVANVSRAPIQVASAGGSAVTAPATRVLDGDQSSSSTDVFAASLGVAAAAALMLTGGFWGVTLARRRPRPDRPASVESGQRHS